MQVWIGFTETELGEKSIIGIYNEQPSYAELSTVLENTNDPILKTNRFGQKYVLGSYYFDGPYEVEDLPLPRKEGSFGDS